MTTCKKCGSTDKSSNGQCKPCKNAYLKEWRQKNRLHTVEYNRRRNAANPELNRQRAREWRKNNPASVHNKRSKEMGAVGTFTNDEWRRICHKYGNKCVKCGSQEKVIPDHIKPLSKGGTNCIENIQPLCYRCNSLKAANEFDYRPDTQVLQPRLFD